MPEPLSSLVALATSLLPLVKTVSGHCKRLYQERQTAHAPPIQSTDIADEVLNQTLDRLRGGNIDDQWWKKILERVGQEYIAPDSLKSNIWQKWLKDTNVVNDLKLLAKAQIMGEDQDHGIRTRLAQSYPDRTYEIHRMEFEPIDVVVAILVAGYLQSIPHDQKALAGMLQILKATIDKHFDELKKELPRAKTDPITQQEHTKYAKWELSRILKLRMFDPLRSRQDIQKLVRRVLENDLCSTNDSQKTEILIWCARLHAQNTETLDLAKKIRDELEQTEPQTDLSIVNALILQTDGQIDKALQLIRDCDDPDSRAVMFSILVLSRGIQDALAWFDNQKGHDEASFFTDTGWANLVLNLAKAGRWDEAIEQLLKLESFREQSPVLALVEGQLNAAMLLPEDSRGTALNTIPLYRDIAPVLGAKAEDHHNRAKTCFEFAEQNLKEIVDYETMQFIADWHLWLRLMDPRDRDATSVRQEISQSMQDGKRAVELMQFAWAFKIQFDPKPLQEHLEERKQFGGLDDRETLAEFFFSEQSLNRRELISYLEQYRESSSEAIPPTTVTSLLIGALAKDGQTEKARRVLIEHKTDLGDVISARLTLLIDSIEGNDPRNQLESLYNETGKSIDLWNLIVHLKEVDDRVGLLPLLRESFRREKTVENAKDLVKCLGGSPFFDYEEIIKFLNDNPEILEQSDDLKESKAWALFQIGKFKESRIINNDLLSRRKNPSDLFLDINIAIASGNWERIPEIFNREWSRRDSHNPEMLISLAQLVSEYGQNTSRALQLAKLAAEKAPENPDILTAAYCLHFQLGHENEADPDWITQALKFSSPDEGPVWSMEIPRVVTEWIPKRQDHLQMVEQKWINGEIPTIIAAKVFNQPLARLFFQIPQNNIDESNGLSRTVLPIISCALNPVELQEDQIIGLDITSIMVLSYLELLEKTFCAFHHIKLPPNIMTLLMQDRQMVRFHQPSRVKAAYQIRELVNRERLKINSDLPAPLQFLTNEVGPDLAELLQAAREQNGYVVCVLPINKAGSHTGQEANIKEYDDLIISTVDFCALLHKNGKMEEDLYGRATSFLRSQGQEEYSNPSESILDGPIFMDNLALSYLQRAKVLKTVSSFRLDIRIHSNVIHHKDMLIQEGNVAESLATKIEEIQDILRNAVESEVASFLPHTVHHTKEEEQNLQDDMEIQEITSMLKGCSEYDVLCVDDSSLNRRQAVEDSTERVIPIACTLDILRQLVFQGLINDDDYFIARHKLRQGGFAVIPLEVDELLYWLKIATFDQTGLRESPELRTLRQSIASINNLGMFDLPNNTILNGISNTCAIVIRKLWQETSLTAEQKKMLSDWVWSHLIASIFFNQKHADRHTRTKLSEELMPRFLALLLSPTAYDLPHGQSTSYLDWIQKSILNPLQLENSHIIEEAIKTVCQMILTLDNNQELYVSLLLKHMPESLRELVRRLEPEFVERFGV